MFHVYDSPRLGVFSRTARYHFQSALTRAMLTVTHCGLLLSPLHIRILMDNF